MQCASPLELRLLGYFDGDAYDERRLHEMFAHARIRGEWFSASDGLLALIREGDLTMARREALREKMQRID